MYILKIHFTLRGTQTIINGTINNLFNNYVPAAIKFL